MAAVFTAVDFDGPVPGLSQIAAMVRERTGLPLAVEESPEDVRGSVFDVHGTIAFECCPKVRLEVHSYRPGAVNEFLQQLGVPPALHPEKLNEQAVHLNGDMLDPTLLFATELALEALGGRPREAISEEMRGQYGGPVAAECLKARQRKIARGMLIAVPLAILLLPLAIALGIIGLGWSFVRARGRVKQAYHQERGRANGAPARPE